VAVTQTIRHSSPNTTACEN